MTHISIDLETLGTSPDSVILSIGAVAFTDAGNLHDGAFYAVLDIDDQTDLKRRISQSTLQWWVQQDAKAKAVFEAKPRMFLADALEALAEWIGSYGDSALVWGNGADFDNAILAHAYTQMNMPVPWRFTNNRCLRTLKNLPGADVKVARVGTHHNALDDALYQAHQIIAIHKQLFGKGKK